MTSSTKEDRKFLSLLNHLVDSCTHLNSKDLTFLSNEHTFKELLLEIEPNLQETGGLIELTKDSSFGVRYGNFVSILKALEAYLLKHSERDTFTTVNLQSLIVINDVLKNDTQQLVLLAEILLFLASISSKKVLYIDKVSELDEAAVSFFFASIEKYIFIDSDNNNMSMSKSILDRSLNAHKYYEKEKKNYINIIKDYEKRMSKMKETIEGLEKAKQVLETKLNDQIRENQAMNANQNKTEAIQEQLITNSLTNNDLMNKLTFKDLEIEELKKEMDLNSKHSLARIAKLEEQLEVQEQKLNEGRELRSQFEKLQSKYKDIKLSQGSSEVTNEIAKALEQKNIQLEMNQKEKSLLMSQIEKLNSEILAEKGLRKSIEFEKKRIELEISELQKDISGNALHQPQHGKLDSSFSGTNKEHLISSGISMEGIINDSIDHIDQSKVPGLSMNASQLIALNDEILKLKEESTHLQLQLEESKATNKSSMVSKEKADIQRQKSDLEMQKLLMMIDRVKNEAKRFEDDNKCLNEKIKEITKSKKSEMDGMKRDIASKTALIETMLTEKKGMVTDYQKLQKEYESFKLTTAHIPSGSAGAVEKKAQKGSGLQQQQMSPVIISNSEVLSLKNEIQNLKLAAIQKDNQIQNLKMKESQQNELTDEEISTKLADLDFYKKSYEEQKMRVNREHELISDSLHKLAIHFMGLKDNLQKKVLKNK